MSEGLVIHKSTVVTDQGQIVQLEYDEEGDLLEIFFERGPANCAVELSDNILPFANPTYCPYLRGEAGCFGRRIASKSSRH